MNTRNSQKTDPTILKMQSVGILLVVVGHMFPETTNAMELPLVPGIIKNWIYSFHMQFFMFLSGFLFFFSVNKHTFDYKSMIVKKIRRLLVPFVVLSSIAFIPKIALSHFANRVTALTPEHFFKMFYIPEYNPIQYFWFLQAIFLIFSFSFVLLFFFRQHILVQILVSILLFVVSVFFKIDITVFSINRALMFVCYFWSGMIAARYVPIGRLCKNPWVIVLSFSIIGIAFYVYATFHIHQTILNILKIVVSFSGIAMCTGIASYWASAKKDYFTFIDGYSYQIYLLSWFFSVLFRIPYQLGIYGFYAASFLRLCASLLFPVLIARYAVKSRSILNPIIGL